MRRWRAWWHLGERERRWQGLRVEDGYGRRGEREARWGAWGEGVVDMGRRWCAWRRLGELERRWRVPGGRRGMGVECRVAAIPYAGAACARGVVA